MLSALTVVFVVISIFGAYAWYRATRSSKGSPDHLAKLFTPTIRTGDNDNFNREQWLEDYAGRLLRYLKWPKQVDYDGDVPKMDGGPVRIEEWAAWVAKGIEMETGTKLTRHQELLILRGLYLMYREKGFVLVHEGGLREDRPLTYPLKVSTKIYERVSDF
jgi:hypothetical protein